MSSLLRAVVTAFLLGLVAFAACGAPLITSGTASPAARSTGSVSPARTPTPQPETAEEAIRQLVAGEGAGLVNRDLEGLMDLWAADAVVTDAKHTPEDPNDDARWRGRDAIRERYTVLVLPGDPRVAGGTDLRIRIDGERAEATGTTAIGAEVAPGGDRWTFVKRDGRWWIESLTYNLEPQ